MLRDTDASIVTVAAALGYASQTAFAAAFKKLIGRNSERLAEARALAAISLQVCQSLWGSRRSGPLEHHGAQPTEEGRPGNGLEKLRRSLCNHIATEGPRVGRHVRTVADRSLHFDSRR